MDRLSPFLTMKEAVQNYGVGRNTLLDAIHNGEIRAYRPNRKSYFLKPEDIDAWIQSYPVAAKEKEPSSRTAQRGKTA